jgi:hypothetical protein
MNHVLALVHIVVEKRGSWGRKTCPLMRYRRHGCEGKVFQPCDGGRLLLAMYLCNHGLAMDPELEDFVNQSVAALLVAGDKDRASGGLRGSFSPIGFEMIPSWVPLRGPEYRNCRPTGVGGTDLRNLLIIIVVAAVIVLRVRQRNATGSSETSSEKQRRLQPPDSLKTGISAPTVSSRCAKEPQYLKLTSHAAFEVRRLSLRDKSPLRRLSRDLAPTSRPQTT